MQITKDAGTSRSFQNWWQLSENGFQVYFVFTDCLPSFQVQHCLVSHISCKACQSVSTGHILTHHLHEFLKIKIIRHGRKHKCWFEKIKALEVFMKLQHHLILHRSAIFECKCTLKESSIYYSKGNKKPHRSVISRHSSIVIISIHNLVVVKDTDCTGLHHNCVTQKKMIQAARKKQLAYLSSQQTLEQDIPWIPIKMLLYMWQMYKVAIDLFPRHSRLFCNANIKRVYTLDPGLNLANFCQTTLISLKCGPQRRIWLQSSSVSSSPCNSQSSFSDNIQPSLDSELKNDTHLFWHLL